MDRLTSMEVFVRVVDCGSFAGAAAAMKLSRGMVSKHVLALEERLSVRLLNRTTRTLNLTEAGAGYYERCRQIVQDAEEADRATSQLQSEPRGDLRINAPMTFGSMHLAPALPDLLGRYPDMSVDLVLNDRVIDLVDEGFDVAIRIARMPDSSLIARKLAPCRLVLCAAPGYLEKFGTPQIPQDLVNHRCLLYSISSSPREWHLSGPEGPVTVKVNGPLRANNGEALMDAALTGLGILMLPTFIAGAHLASGALVPIMTNYAPRPLTINAVYPHNRHLSAKVRAFVDFMVERFGTTPAWDQWAMESDQERPKKEIC
ncbi:LysR family transcriptional regulator [Fodinicurvata sp. EGI_FJ10296]|uniref:LysR family transcriptional regulator n=1 Tax=Fodinicurvata sp. EGI_FJ10296 TaxID=3231908 RepID=UPI0034570180